MRVRAAIVLALTSARLALPAGTDSLENLLGRMDQAAASFKSFSADIRSVQHTAVIDEDNADSGRIALKRSKRDMRMLVELTQPDRKAIALQGNTLEIYYPKREEVEVYDIGGRRELVEQFLLVGFGTSGKELASAYDVKLTGADTVPGQAAPATRLELVPKSAEVLKNLKKLELWYPESNAYPVQQKFYLPGGDYKLVTYTNVKVNPPLGDSDLKLKVPQKAKRVHPQQ
jgi:outer membrane lipoprotein-sorting protein